MILSAALKDLKPGIETSREPGTERRSVYLHPGRLLVAAEACAITTILGSCVAVCLWDPMLRLGGINHYLLPYGGANSPASARFGNIAIECLIEELAKRGSLRMSIQAKLFGGARMLESFQAGGNDLGGKNIEIARSTLEREGIPVIAEDTGGRRGRKLIFNTDDGAAWVRKI
jgi:chemotaxis protein CheD